MICPKTTPRLGRRGDFLKIVDLSLSPNNFNNNNANVRNVNSSGNANNYDFVNTSFGVRPVINLKPDSLKSGDGSASNPYRIEA